MGPYYVMQPAYRPQACESSIHWVGEYDYTVYIYSWRRPCHPPALHLDVPLFRLVSPRRFHNNLTTLAFSNVKCSGEVCFTGLAPIHCQTAVDIAWPSFWRPTCRLWLPILKQPHISIARVAMLSTIPCTTCLPMPTSCMCSMTTGFF